MILLIALTWWISWTAPGDDGMVGQADHYNITLRGDTIDAPAPSPAWSRDSVEVEFVMGENTFVISAVDEAGNEGDPATFTIWVREIGDNVSCGDVYSDGIVNVFDLVKLVDILFKGDSCQ